MSRITIKVERFIQKIGELPTINFTFDVPELRVAVGGMYFNAWPQKAKAAVYDRARAASRQAVSHTINVPLQSLNSWVEKYLTKYSNENNHLLVAAEFIAQQLFLGIVKIPEHGAEKNALYELLCFIAQEEVDWCEYPPWFSLGEDSQYLYTHVNSDCSKSGLLQSREDSYCSNCGCKFCYYEAPILQPYSCLNKECPNHGKKQSFSHKRCSECGKELGFPIKKKKS